MELKSSTCALSMSRSASKLKKARGKLATHINGHTLDEPIRVPAGGLDVEEIALNLLLLRESRGDLLFDFSNYKPYVRLIAQCMGLKQEHYPCCYGPQMPPGIYKSVKAT